jgi:hypothetical protein
MEDTAEPEGQPVRAKQLRNEMVQSLPVLERVRPAVHVLDLRALHAQVSPQTLPDVGAQVPAPPGAVDGTRRHVSAITASERNVMARLAPVARTRRVPAHRPGSRAV